MTTKTMTAVESFNRVKESAEAIKCDQPQRFPEAASVGDCWRQGDVYLTRLGEVPHGCRKIDQPEAQLAPGTTQGSRHVLDSLDGVTLYELDNATPLDGPVLETTCERTVTHPEHGDLVLPPGVYGVTYQRAYADELRRVAD